MFTHKSNVGRVQKVHFALENKKSTYQWQVQKVQITYTFTLHTCVYKNILTWQENQPKIAQTHI